MDEHISKVDPPVTDAMGFSGAEVTVEVSDMAATSTTAHALSLEPPREVCFPFMYGIYST
jgi:hypothetical protein